MHISAANRVINNPEKCANFIKRQPGYVSRLWTDDRGVITEIRAIVKGSAFYARRVNSEWQECGVEYSAPVGFLSF